MSKMLVLTGLAWFIMAATAFAGPSGETEKQFLLSFVVGDYDLVGQYPDSSVAYSGFARIERIKDRLTLTRQIGSKTIIAEGRIEVPQPPGEGNVVRFRWTDKDPVVMTCLVTGDLDNYARLTCNVAIEGRAHTKPGIEALFPTATWPKKPARQTLHQPGSMSQTLRQK